nr:protein translocase subunit SecD [Thermicanus aegyptius]
MVKWNRVVLFFLLTLLIFLVMGFTFQPILNGVTLGLDLKGGFEILYQLQPTEGTKVTGDLLSQTKDVLERRISVLGVAEPDISIEYPDRIRIQLAGVTNQDEARKILATEANLTFRDMSGKVLMTGADLKEGGAGVGFDNLGKPLVTLKLKDAGKFEKITRDYLGQQIGIYLDDNLLQAPKVQAIIPGGEATITGQESVQAAQELAGLLNAGALPVKLNEISSTSVSATLGQMALQRGIFAGMITGSFILLFMLLFYRLPGFVAIITLTVYIYLLLLTMVLMGATLTLPGIAAFILGVGMAVDANIITYERIKDEIRSGKTLLSSFRAGTRRSFLTILDANITTIIAGIVLFIFGTSAIKGFAVILILSNVLSILTNVGLSRILLSLLVRSNWLNKPFYYGVKESEIGEL